MDGKLIAGGFMKAGSPVQIRDGKVFGENERFVVCSYGDHGHGYEPIGVYDDSESADAAMNQIAKTQHVEVYAFSPDNVRRYVGRKAREGSDE